MKQVPVAFKFIFFLSRIVGFFYGGSDFVGLATFEADVSYVAGETNRVTAQESLCENLRYVVRKYISCASNCIV